MVIRPDGSAVSHLDRKTFNVEGFYKFMHSAAENYIFKDQSGEIHYITYASNIGSNIFLLLNKREIITRAEVEKRIKMRSFW